MTRIQINHSFSDCPGPHCETGQDSCRISGSLSRRKTLSRISALLTCPGNGGVPFASAFGPEALRNRCLSLPKSFYALVSQPAHKPQILPVIKRFNPPPVPAILLRNAELRLFSLLAQSALVTFLLSLLVGHAISSSSLDFRSRNFSQFSNRSLSNIPRNLLHGFRQP